MQSVIKKCCSNVFIQYIDKNESFPFLFETVFPRGIFTQLVSTEASLQQWRLLDTCVL